MKLHQLSPKVKKPAKTRKGQGNGSKGTFSGRGCKGQNSRAGGGVRLGFEGGQSGILARMPKLRGFKNPNRVETQIVTLSDLDANFKTGEKVTLEALVTKGIVRAKNTKVKVLANGETSKKFEFSEDILVSEGVKKAIGGSAPKKAAEKAEEKDA